MLPATRCSCSKRCRWVGQRTQEAGLSSGTCDGQVYEQHCTGCHRNTVVN